MSSPKNLSLDATDSHEFFPGLDVQSWKSCSYDWPPQLVEQVTLVIDTGLGLEVSHLLELTGRELTVTRSLKLGSDTGKEVNQVVFHPH